jgi:hypothetical protein
MYRDTEQAYGRWTLDVYQHGDQWHCDWWDRMKPFVCGSVVNRRRAEAIRLAKAQCDEKEKT